MVPLVLEVVDVLLEWRVSDDGKKSGQGRRGVGVGGVGGGVGLCGVVCAVGGGFGWCGLAYRRYGRARRMGVGYHRQGREDRRA